MKIMPREGLAARQKIIECELCRLRAQGPATEPVCAPNCPDYAAAIGCHRQCVKIPERLSSAGDQAPIEALIAPLAFELKRLGVFHPCWSCEGHDNAAGYLWKIPRLWFYADSVIHVRCLRDAIADLAGLHRLSSQWVIVITFSDHSNPDTTFSLEPGPLKPDARLSDLQHDVRVIAEHLAEIFWDTCEQLSRRSGAVTAA